ncbi:MAG: DUF177 domain-containing protein [Muribaculaceae bacterium]|nr:DUF177 domain-containing protein [Muribaculaceae bacterium]
MGKFTAYKLPLKSLTKGTHTFDYHLDKQFFANMENNDVRDADLNVHLTVDYNGEIYALSFEITGEVLLLCDRCLDDLHLPIDTRYEISVKYGDDYNDDSDTMIEIPDSDNYLNVAYMIYDTVVLAIPIKHVHPMGKCNRQMSAILKKHRAGGAEGDDDMDEFMDGIDDDAPAAGGSDPRWDALRGMGSDAEA